MSRVPLNFRSGYGPDFTLTVLQRFSFHSRTLWGKNLSVCFTHKFHSFSTTEFITTFSTLVAIFLCRCSSFLFTDHWLLFWLIIICLYTWNWQYVMSSHLIFELILKHQLSVSAFLKCVNLPVVCFVFHLFIFFF